MKTILHICEWHRPIGGAERVLYTLLDLLGDRGHDNVLVYNAHKDQQPMGRWPEYACPGQEPHAYFRFRSRLLTQLAKRRIRSVIKRHRPDICHVHSLMNPYLLDWLNRRLPVVRHVQDNRPLCLTGQLLLPDGSVCRKGMGKECLRRGCLSKGPFPRTVADLDGLVALRRIEVHRRLPFLIASGREVIRHLTASGVAPENIAWLPYHTDIPPREEAEAFKQARYRADDPMVLFMGRASHEKGGHVFIDAVSRLQTPCRALIVAKGDMLESYRQQVRELGIQVDIIPGVGFDETRQYFAQASVTVVPSINPEAFGLVGIESYAAMTPVIGSRVGGIPDWLVHEKTGWLVEPSDPAQLARAMEDALSDPDRLRKMGTAGYERAASLYTRELFYPRLKAIYDQAIQRFAARTAC